MRLSALLAVLLALAAAAAALVPAKVQSVAPAGDESVAPLLKNAPCDCVLLPRCACREFVSPELAPEQPRGVEVVSDIPRCGCATCQPCVDNRYSQPEILDDSCHTSPCGNGKVVMAHIDDGTEGMVRPAEVKSFN